MVEQQGDDLVSLIADEVARKRASLCDRLVDRPIPELNLSDVVFQGQDGPFGARSLFAEGGFGKTYIVSCPALDPDRPFLLKHLHQRIIDSIRHEPPDSRRAICERLTRPFLFCDANDARTIPGLLLPSAYLLDGRYGIMFLSRKRDIDLRSLTNALIGPDTVVQMRDPPEGASDRLRAAFGGVDGTRWFVHHVTHSLLRTASAYYSAGNGRNLHRDYKPTNIVLDAEPAIRYASIRSTPEFLAADAAVPFLSVIDWDLIFAEDRHVIKGTTLHAGFAGDPAFASYDLQMGDPTKERLRDPVRDVISLGWTLATLIGYAPHQGFSTNFGTRDSWLRSDAPRRVSREIGLPDFHTLVALAVRGHIRDAPELHERACEVLAGGLRSNRQRARIASELRRSEQEMYERRERKRYITTLAKRSLPFAAGTALSLLVAAGFADGIALRRYRAEHAASPAAAAKILVRHPDDPDAWDRYARSWTAQLLADDEQLYRTESVRASPSRVPVGSFTQADGKVAFWTGNDFDIGALIAQYAVAYETSGNPAFLDPLSFYLDEFVLETAADRGTDFTSSAVGRAEPVLVFSASLERIVNGIRGGSVPARESVATAIDDAILRARYAALIGVHQFIERWNPIPNPLKAYNEYQLIPLVALVARDPSLLPDPAAQPRSSWESELRERLRQRYGTLAIDPGLLRHRLIESGVAVCDALIEPSGKSYGMVEVRDGLVVRNLSSPDQPTADAEDPVRKTVALADHAGLYLSMAARLWSVASSQEPAAALRDCAGRLERFAIDAADGGILPEFSPRPAVSGPYAPLDQDALAEARFQRGLLYEGRVDEARVRFLHLLEKAKLRSAPMPRLFAGRDLWSAILSFPAPYESGDVPFRGGDFPDASWYSWRYHGPNTMTAGELRRVEWIVRLKY